MPLSITRCLLGFMKKSRLRKVRKRHKRYFITMFSQLTLFIMLKFLSKIIEIVSLCAWYGTDQIIHMSENYHCSCFCLFFRIQKPVSRIKVEFLAEGGKNNAEKGRERLSGSSLGIDCLLKW